MPYRPPKEMVSSYSNPIYIVFGIAIAVVTIIASLFLGTANAKHQSQITTSYQLMYAHYDQCISETLNKDFCLYAVRYN